MKSKLFSIGKSSAFKAFIMSILTTVVGLIGDAILQEMANGSYSFDGIHWREIGMATIASVIAYLKKEFLTNSNGEFLKKDE